MFAYIDSKLSKIKNLEKVKWHKEYETIKGNVDPLKA